MSQDKSYRRVYPDRILQFSGADDRFILLLHDSESEWVIPIMIGQKEAQSIMLSTSGETPIRPMTHDLTVSIMESYGLQLKEVTIDRFDEGIFYGSLIISDGFNEKRIDCRPSDGITLANLTGCPVSAATAVIQETSVPADRLVSQADEINEPTLEELERLLKHYEETDDFDRAEEVLKQIQQLKSHQNKNDGSR